MVNKSGTPYIPRPVGPAAGPLAEDLLAQASAEGLEEPSKGALLRLLRALELRYAEALDAAVNAALAGGEGAGALQGEARERLFAMLEEAFAGTARWDFALHCPGLGYAALQASAGGRAGWQALAWCAGCMRRMVSRSWAGGECLHCSALPLLSLFAHCIRCPGQIMMWGLACSWLQVARAGGGDYAGARCRRPHRRCARNGEWSQG